MSHSESVKNREESGLIFDIKRYAINDGPGIRVAVFLKGCPLSCKWCHNPEGMSRYVQKMYTESKCIGARECITICPPEALRLTPQGVVTDMERCDLCGKCAEVCPTKAIEMSGRMMSVNEIMQVVKKEILVMDNSGGGITFSGGEPLHHHRFLISLLDACGSEGIHRCVDTSGFCHPGVLLEVAKRTDLFLYDLKMMDPVRHEFFTGVSNQRILSNLRLLAEQEANIIIRIPLVKGVNDDTGNIVETAEYISSLPGDNMNVSILPYHDVAARKYEKLGLAYEVDQMEKPSAASLETIKRIFEEYGINATIGG